MLQEPPPEIILLATEWQARALIRAQLIEEGFDVVATNTWAMMRRHLRPGSKPQLAIVDLKDLPDPQRVLNDVQQLTKPNRVLVLTAIGTMRPNDVKRLGLWTLSRPLAIKDVVETVAHAIRSREGGFDTSRGATIAPRLKT